MEEKFLPIGTVVILKGGTKKIMITGYCVETIAKKDKIFDYRGCPYPTGVLESAGVALFDHNQIKEICYKGFVNEESVNLSDKLNIILNAKDILNNA